MLYPVELWDQNAVRTSTFRLQRCDGTGTLVAFLNTKKGPSQWTALFAFQPSWNQLPLVRPEVLSPPFFLDFFFFLSSVVAEALPDLLQHPEDEDLLQEAPLASVEADAPLEQHPADLDLSQVALSPLVHEVFWASLEQVCSVLAFLSAGA